MSNDSKNQRQGNPQIEDGFVMIAVELAVALARTNLSPREHRYLWALFLKTYRWQKKSDWIADSQITAITGMARPHVNDAKHKLLRRGVIMLDGRKIGPNKHYKEWGVPKQVHVPESGHPSTGTGNKNVPDPVRKNTDASTHKRREIKDSLTKEPTEREEQFRIALLQRLGMGDFSEPLPEQWPFVREFLALTETDGPEKSERKWRGVKRLDHFKNIRKLAKLFSLYKSQPL